MVLFAFGPVMVYIFLNNFGFNKNPEKNED